jgi:hypothetical protein
MKDNKQITQNKTKRYFFIVFCGGLLSILAVLFARSFVPSEVVFSNDGPLGAMVARQNRMPAIVTGFWLDLNWIGGTGPTPSPSISSLIRLLTTPVTFAKFFYPISLFLLGISAWFCFRQWKLAPTACALGGFAAALSSHYFSTACWGVAAQVIAVGMNFVAIGLLAKRDGRRQWVRVILAGMAVGMGIMEGYDIGALFSIFVAAFVLYLAIISEGKTVAKLSAGIVKIGVVAGFSAFLAAQALSTLVGTQIKGVETPGGASESKEQQWDFTTQWSFPPSEVPQLFAAGIFGYRQDTPKNMGYLPDWFQGGNYWGEIGRDPALDRAMKTYEASGRQGQHPEGGWRFSGGGEYASVLVVIIALWGSLQSLRKKESVFTLMERKILWFWMGVAIVSLLLSFGRYAPFYRVFFMLPYASTIRNATKFTHTFHWAMLIIFAFSMHGLCRRYLEGAVARLTTPNPGFFPYLKSWWAKTSGFDKRWARGIGIAAVVSLIAWFLYATSGSDLTKHLQEVGFADAGSAAAIASFSIHSFGWSVVVFAIAGGLLIVILSGWFTGTRARTGAILLGLFLVIDLARANLPWLIYWDYPDKYASNPIIDILKTKPFEHRVAIFPLERFMRFDRLPEEVRPLAQSYMKLHDLYHVEWKQQHWQYYDIQSLDIVQMPRRPVDYVAFETALGANPLRHWELTNTRYFLAPTALLSLLNQQFDPNHRFKIAASFDIVPKLGAPDPAPLEKLTATLNTNGEFSLIEFTGALPRAKLYENWQVSTNDQATLAKLAAPDFSPGSTVLVNNSLSGGSSTARTNETAGSVEYLSYAPKKIVLRAKAANPSVLLLNDKYDESWKVIVDGKSATLLRCNYIMRGVQVPTGEHTVEFQFKPSITGLYISLAAIVLALGLIGFLAVTRDHPETVGGGLPPVPGPMPPAKKRI